MSKINIIIVHGIGNEREGYSKDLQSGIKKEFGNYIGQILGAPDNYSSEVVFHEVLWNDILSENQNKLKEILKKTQTPSMQEKGVLGWIKYQCVKGYESFRASFVTESICDILGYKNDEVYRGIHEKIVDKINKIEKSTFITFVSHSLGTVISSDFVYDCQTKKNNKINNLNVGNFFIMGSPLAVFSLKYGKGLFKDPIRLDDTNGRWLNIFYKNDPIAYELKVLNDAFNKAVLKDCNIGDGPFGLAHLLYWGDVKVHKIIAHKIALDWMRDNNKITKENIEKLYKEYDYKIGV